MCTHSHKFTPCALACCASVGSHSMCLFLQTQNFQQVTAALVTDMHASSAAANASLGHIRSDLAQQSMALAQSVSALSKLQTVQVEVQSAVQAGLVEVKAVVEVSQGLQRSMQDSLNMTVRRTAMRHTITSRREHSESQVH